MSQDLKTFAENLRRVRRAARITQAELAESADVTTNAVSEWERGVTLPRADRLPTIAEALYTSIDDLFGIASTEDRPGPSKAQSKLIGDITRLSPTQVRLVHATVRELLRGGSVDL